MKKIALFLIVAFILIILVSSCSQKVCPAYSRSETGQTGNKV